MAGHGNMASSAFNKSMGIQFVKSKETISQSSQSDSSLLQSGNSTSSASNANSIPALMSCQTRPISMGQEKKDNPTPTPFQAFVKSGESYSSLQSNASGFGLGYRMPGQSNLNKNAQKSDGGQRANTFHRVAEAKAVCSVDQYLNAWKFETDNELIKLRKLAYEVVTLKSDRPNAKDKLHSAANRVPVRIEFNTQPVFGAKNNNSFLCYVYIEGVSMASGQGPKIKDAKTNAYENALQKILMPFLRIVQIDPTAKELQVSKVPFTSPPPQPSKVPIAPKPSLGGKDQVKEVPSQHKESNLEAAGIKRRYNEFKPLDEFVIVEPKIPIQDCTAAHTLRRSADFNHMLLEYEYFFKGEAARCILRIENEVLADVNGVSKAAAKNAASHQALLKLKSFCWVIKTKQAVDSNTKISKEEMLNELNEQSDTLDQNNIGNKLLRKMGWSGGGVGKDGSGIAEPVALKSVLNREGLGLSASKGVTDEFRRRVKEVIENYAASDNQEDLVFSCDFRLEERQIIHDECRRLNLRSKSKGKGQKRYLCVRRKRSVNQLFDHLMSVGGETARYQLVPPGQDTVGGASNLSNLAPRNGDKSTSNGTPSNPFNQPFHAGTSKSFPSAGNSQASGNSFQGNYSSTTFSSQNKNGPGFSLGANQQGFFQNGPPQNGFPNSGTGTNKFQERGKNPPSMSANFSSGNGADDRPCQSVPSHFQQNFNDNFRPNGHTNSQYPHGNNSSNNRNNAGMRPPMNPSNSPRAMGNGGQYGCPSQMMTNSFQPSNVYAMNQARAPFQGFHNNMPMPRPGFDAMSPMTSARGPNPCSGMGGMMNDWNSFGMGGRHGANMRWEMHASAGNSYGGNRGMNPHQQMPFQPETNSGGYNCGGFR